MAWILAILVLVIAIVLNMIISRLDFSWDISPNKQYSLSSTTEKYLDQLDSEGKTVDFYVLTTEESLKNDMDSLTLYRALEEYDAHKSINLIWSIRIRTMTPWKRSTPTTPSPFLPVT